MGCHWLGGSLGFRDGRYKTSGKDVSYVAGLEWVGHVANAPFVWGDGVLEVSPQDCPMLGAESFQDRSILFFTGGQEGRRLLLRDGRGVHFPLNRGALFS